MWRFLSLTLLAVVSLATTFVGLSHPAEVVFDEVHFGKFVTAYCCTGKRFFDIHPPHGKLLIAGGAYALGYRGGFSFENIGQAYDEISQVSLRFVSATAGGLVPPVVFAILLTLGVSRRLSFLGGLLVALDNALTVQSRVIGLDSLLLLFSFVSVWLFLVWLRGRSGRWRPWLLPAAGAAAGAAVGIKFTGLAALGTIGVVLGVLVIVAIWRRLDGWQGRTLSYIRAGLIVLASAAIVYLVGWVLHFTILDQPGPGDAWGERTGSLTADIVQEHRLMLGANYNLGADHPYGSPWWTWPAMARPVFYWAGQDGSWIYFQGNPLVWWGSSALFIAALVHVVTAPQRRRQAGYATILLVGFAVAYAPFIRVPRVLFLYHYLTPLIFTTLFAVWWMDKVVTQPRLRHIIWWAAIGGAIAGFLLFAPVTYGFDAWQEWLIWFPKWR